MAEMMYQGNLYVLTNQGWTRNGEIVYQGLQKQLFAELEKQRPLGTLIIKDILETADILYNVELFNSAIQYYESILKQVDANTNNIKYMLPRLSSSYRKVGTPDRSIELLGQYAQPEYESTAFLTSVGAAYMDEGNIAAADHLARRAYHLNGGHADPELNALFGRIRAASN